MDARVALLHLWTVLVLLTAELKWIDAAEVYTNAWAVQINGGPEEADRIAREHGFINHGNVFGDYYHFRHHAVEKRALSGHLGMHIRLQKEPQVLWAEQQVVKKRKKRDIYEDPTDPDFSKQWYLSTPTHQDLNTKIAWAQGYTGRGVVVTILDDGIEKDHPDLVSNYDPEASYDVNDGDADPQPRYTQRNENSDSCRSLPVFGRIKRRSPQFIDGTLKLQQGQILLPSPMFLQHGLLPELNPPGADEKLHPVSEKHSTICLKSLFSGTIATKSFCSCLFLFFILGFKAQHPFAVGPGEKSA